MIVIRAITERVNVKEQKSKEDTIHERDNVKGIEKVNRKKRFNNATKIIIHENTKILLG